MKARDIPELTEGQKSDKGERKGRKGTIVINPPVITTCQLASRFHFSESVFEKMFRPI